MTALQKIDPVAQEIVPISDGAALMTAVARAAADPNVDVEKMERLFAMHERMAARQAEQDYASAMVRAQKAMPNIAKTSENKQTKSWYADLQAINERITPVYTECGFALSFGQEDSPIADHVRVVCDVLHVGGHTKRYTYDNPIDDAGIQGAKNKTPTHGRSSGISYGRRYITTMVFNLTLGGEDNDGNGDAIPDQKESDWLRVAEGLQDAPSYNEQRKKMKADYGDDPSKIPPAVIKAFNDARSRVMPKD